MSTFFFSASTADPASAPNQARERFTNYVLDPAFPCVGARSAVNKQRMRFGRYGAMNDAASVDAMRADLLAFSQEFPDPGQQPVSFVAMFADQLASEEDFDARLWQLLQSVHDADRHEFAWDASVNIDPSASDFSFSVAGRAFFVVGLSPVASRLARRAPTPCLVFNFHNQFDALRESGKYAGMQTVIRKRDVALQGAINPVLARFGEASEARQYSGRAVGAAWVCPFKHLGAGDVH